MRILVLNAGSSSQKSCLYDLRDPLPDDAQPPLWEARVEWRESGGGRLRIQRAGQPTEERQIEAASHQEALGRLLETLRNNTASPAAGPAIDVAGHRVVHGGAEYAEPVLITPQVKATLGRIGVFAPLHNRAEIQGMEAVEQCFGTIPQVAVFDTAFHRSLPEETIVYPGPYEWLHMGIRRYGFHGINHQYCAGRAARLLNRNLASLRLIICHLGGGCSLAAVLGGRSVETTMGFTPLEGLMMSTRAGSLDPGILLYLMRRSAYTPEQLDDILNHRSGLLGVSGVSGDMREVLAARARGESRADLAFRIFIHRLSFHIGAMLPSLGGLDALVFSGGIGENSPEVRAAACERLAFLGVEVDRARNSGLSSDGDIAAAGSRVRVLMIRAQEDWVIAQACRKMLHGQPPPKEIRAG
jgi:acetate kinase